MVDKILFQVLLATFSTVLAAESHMCGFIATPMASQAVWLEMFISQTTIATKLKPYFSWLLASNDGLEPINKHGCWTNDILA